MPLIYWYPIIAFILAVILVGDDCLRMLAHEKRDVWISLAWAIAWPALVGILIYLIVRYFIIRKKGIRTPFDAWTMQNVSPYA